MRATITYKDGNKITLHKFGKKLILIDVPYGFKKDENYINLKKQILKCIA